MRILYNMNFSKNKKIEVARSRINRGSSRTHKCIFKKFSKIFLDLKNEVARGRINTYTYAYTGVCWCVRESRGYHLRGNVITTVQESAAIKRQSAWKSGKTAEKGRRLKSCTKSGVPIKAAVRPYDATNKKRAK